jgi:hypothetical protein
MISKLSSKTKKKFFIGSLITLVILLGYWFYSQLEWEEKEIDLGYSKEAQRNNFLAAEIFLRKHGVQAITIKNLSLLDKQRWRNIELGDEDTLVLINANKTLTQARYDRLYEWVENGGTLITSTQNPFVGSHTDEEDLLLSDFGIIPAKDYSAGESPNLLENITDEFNKNEDAEELPEGDKEKKPEINNSDINDKKIARKNDKQKKASKKEEPERPENYYRCSLDEEPTTIDFADEQTPLRFDFTRQDPFIYYDDEGIDNAPEDGEEAHVLYFDVGAGSITVTSDNYIWSNSRIDCHDHAYALWNLVNPNGRVWFLINQDAPSLAAIIWNSAKYAVLASALALILWLWAKASRFGPLFNVGQQGRRSLAEHIHASAMLLWRKQQHPQLLKFLRGEILERLQQQHPQLASDNSRVARIQLIQQLTGLKEADIQQALYADDAYQPQAFANAIANLQIIRKQL